MASRGWPPASSLAASTDTRFSTQWPPVGAGKRAGSPSAAHTSRDAGSAAKPPTGFHALHARPGAATSSQPFHGKSLSLAVRTKMGVSSPACPSAATFSMPREKSAL